MESTGSLLNNLLPSSKARIIPFKYQLLSRWRAFCSSNASCIPTKAFPASSSTSLSPSDSGYNSTSTLDLFHDRDSLVPALGFHFDTGSKSMVHMDLRVKHHTHNMRRLANHLQCQLCRQQWSHIRSPLVIVMVAYSKSESDNDDKNKISNLLVELGNCVRRGLASAASDSI